MGSSLASTCRNTLRRDPTGWYHLTVQSVEILRVELVKGKYAQLVEKEAPLKVLIGASTIIYPGGPSAFELRRITHEFHDTANGPALNNLKYTPWMKKSKM